MFVRPDALSLICMLHLVLFVFDILSSFFGIDVVDIFFSVQKINLDDRFGLVLIIEFKIKSKIKISYWKYCIKFFKGWDG